MKVSMIATADDGGAGRAAVRLMEGLTRFSDVDANMIVKKKRTSNEKVRQIATNNPFFDYISRQFFVTNVPQNHVLTSIMYSGTEAQYLKMMETADIIHLHWVANFVSAESMRYWDEMGKGLLWTFHDRNPMTGGCHCTYGCSGYEKDCDRCPEMVDNPYNISKYLLEIKKQYIPKNTIVVAPSRWMAECARKSAIFHDHRIEVIPNSVDTKLFRPLDKNRCRARLGIANDAKVVLYCAENPEQIHKGYRYFFEAMQWVAKTLATVQLKKIVLLLIGKADAVLNDMKTLGMTIISLGYIKDDALLAASYTAADVTVFPSLEESFGNVIIESLSCGTPVTGFRVGGLPDIIQDGGIGIVVEPKDSRALGNAVIKMLASIPSKAACRKFAEEKFTLELQATRYKDLYDEMIATPKRPGMISARAFELPQETHKVLAPYYFETMEYLETLDELAARRFLKGVSLEDDVLNFVLWNHEWIKDYPDDSVAIWGAGSFAKRLIDALLALNLAFDKKMRGFFDANPRGKSIWGYPYLTNEDIHNGKVKMIIIGSPKFENEIYCQIQQYEKMGLRILRLRWEYEQGTW